MSQFTHVLVTAAEGRIVPVPSSDATVAGLKLEAGKVYPMPWSSYVRRRLGAGDLVLVDRSGKPVKEPKDAAVDASTKINADGTLDTDQRPDDVINAERAKAAELEHSKTAAAASTVAGKDR